jgi:hypothetical protein
MAFHEVGIDQVHGRAEHDGTHACAYQRSFEESIVEAAVVCQGLTYTPSRPLGLREFNVPFPLFFVLSYECCSASTFAN